MGKQRTLQNINSVVSKASCEVGVATMSSWILNFEAFARSSPRMKYGHFLQKYNLLPGQYWAVFNQINRLYSR